MNKIAHWQTKGKDYLDLFNNGPALAGKGNDYFYSGNGCGGGFTALSDEEAISRMEAPWGDPRGTGQVTVLKSDRPSLKRVL